MSGERAYTLLSLTDYCKELILSFLGDSEPFLTFERHVGQPKTGLTTHSGPEEYFQELKSELSVTLTNYEDFLNLFLQEK